MSLVPTTESLVKTLLRNQLPVLINLLGIAVTVHRHTNDVYDKVYGPFAQASETDTDKEFYSDVIFTDLDFSVVDSDSAAVLSIQQIYALEPASLTSTGITFTADTKKLSIASGSSFSSLQLRASEKFKVAGSHSNNKDFTVVSASDTEIVVNELVVSEVAGSSVTLEVYRIGVGDTFNVTRTDSKYRKFKVTGIESIGITKEVVSRYVVSAIGD